MPETRIPVKAMLQPCISTEMADSTMRNQVPKEPREVIITTIMTTMYIQVTPVADHLRQPDLQTIHRGSIVLRRSTVRLTELQGHTRAIKTIPPAPVAAIIVCSRTRWSVCRKANNIFINCCCSSSSGLYQWLTCHYCCSDARGWGPLHVLEGIFYAQKKCALKIYAEY